MKIGYKISDLIAKHGPRWVADMLFRDLDLQQFCDLTTQMEVVWNDVKG